MADFLASKLAFELFQLERTGSLPLGETGTTGFKLSQLGHNAFLKAVKWARSACCQRPELPVHGWSAMGPRRHLWKEKRWHR